MAMDLTGIIGKIERADHHLRKFRAEARTLLDSYAGSVAPCERTDSWEEWRLNQVPAIPAHWPAVVGDIAHNLRSALDHLAWQLVVESGARPRRERPATAFPIRTASGSSPPTIFPAIRAEFQQVLESVQPYIAFATAQGLNPRKSPLFMLQELNNLDKHVAIVPAVGVLDTVSWSSPPESEVRFVRNPAALHHDDVVGRFFFGPAGRVDVNPSFNFVVRADIPTFPEIEAGDLCDWALSTAMSYVKSTVRRFAEAACQSPG